MPERLADSQSPKGNVELTLRARTTLQMVLPYKVSENDAPALLRKRIT